MKSLLSIILTVSFTLTCMGQYEVENFRGEALESKEFKEFSNAYRKYLNQANLYRDIVKIDRLKMKDTLSQYYIETDSLLSIMKANAKAFYAKYPFKKLKWTPDQFTAYLINR